MERRKHFSSHVRQLSLISKSDTLRKHQEEYRRKLKKNDELLSKAKIIIDDMRFSQKR